MPRKQKKYHFIYKTTNLINDKFYVGMHSTGDLEDGYFGSGKVINYSVNSHGIENHQVEILEFLSSREELKKREAEVVNEELLADPLCMNLKFGGEGGWDHWNNSPDWEWNGSLANKAVHQKTAESRKRRFTSDAEYREKQLARAKNARTELAKKYPNGAYCGKKHSEETKQKMRKSKNVGATNSQFGTCWIQNGEETKKVNKEELNFWLNLGWVKGRKLKV